MDGFLLNSEEYEDWVVEQVNAALDEADAGFEEELNIDSIKQEGRDCLQKEL